MTLSWKVIYFILVLKVLNLLGQTVETMVFSLDPELLIFLLIMNGLFFFQTLKFITSLELDQITAIFYLIPTPLSQKKKDLLDLNISSSNIQFFYQQLRIFGTPQIKILTLFFKLFKIKLQFGVNLISKTFFTKKKLYFKKTLRYPKISLHLL